MSDDVLSGCIGFDWDVANLEKNWVKHQVTPFECEQIFFNQPLVVAEDAKHSQIETRYYALGRTDVGRHLFIAFTIRRKFIRIISARDMSRKERKIYGT
jgi:uncharacterized DUF497 family protein